MNTTASLPKSTTAGRRRRPLLIVAGLISVSMLAAACGDDDAASMASEPMTSEPMTTQPMTTQPMTTQPMTSEPMMADGPFGPACDAVPADGAGSFAGMAQEPAATAASNNPLLSTLVSAVGVAGLVDTLNGPGPFTIFAPVDDAFAAIPADQLQSILADTDLLTSILTFHVIAGEQLDAAALGAAGTAVTVNGAELSFGADGTTVNGAAVLCSNVMTANATVHIIDTVLVPEG